MALTAEELKLITQENAKVISQVVAEAVAAAIAESRKPLPPTEKEIQELEQRQIERASNAATVIAKMENKRALQRICSHMHKTSEGGGTHGVWVKEEDPRSPGYIYCQSCEANIRPGSFNPDGLPHERDRRAIYDTVTFNRLFQECGSSGLIG